MREVTEQEFDAVLADAPGLVLVDFWAEWCGPCRALKPVLESMASVYEGKVDFIAVDTDRNKGLMRAFGVRSLPTVLLLKPNEDGPGAEVLSHAIGVQTARQYHGMIEKGLSPKKGILKRLFG